MNIVNKNKSNTILIYLYLWKMLNVAYVIKWTLVYQSGQIEFLNSDILVVPVCNFRLLSDWNSMTPWFMRKKNTKVKVQSNIVELFL